ncbi:MAG: RNA polymerase nonessential primary-like sigma factor [Oleiphilaceae bacterium]|jgi:RNA polymerase sigma factor (sigma-70 family)
MLQQEVLELHELFDHNDVPEKGLKLLNNLGKAKDKYDLPFEDQCFAAIRKSGISMLLVMSDDPTLLDPLKNLILNVEEQILKYNIQDSQLLPAKEIDLLGLIDTLETLWYISDFKGFNAKKNRLKRRLSDWAPASYLIENAIRDYCNSNAVSLINKEIKKKLESSLTHYYSYRNRMVQANIRLVYSVANRFRHLGLAYEDLVQEGNLGLIKAVERFDISKGFRFSTYAHIVISQSIHLAIDKQVSLVRLPFKALREKAAVEKVRQSLEQTLGRSPTIGELEIHLSDDLEYKSTHISNAIEPSANSQNIYSSPDDSELIEEMSPLDQDMKTSSLSHSDFINRVLARLDERESYIVRMRYGIGLNKEYTLEEISQTIGLSRERIRQVSHHAIEKLSRSFSHCL